MKAYCVFENFEEEAKKIIINNNIELTVNSSKNRPNGEELIELLKRYDILIMGVFSKLTADMIKYVRTPKIIATLSVGLDHIDNAFFESPLVEVVNIELANTRSVAEHIFSLILALTKRLYESNYLVLKQEGHRNSLHDRPNDLSDKTLGLIGAGNIAKQVIKIAQVFNMKIKCYTKNPDKHQELLRNKVEFVSLDEILKESDIINVSIPLNNETEKLITREKINLMKPTATFINTSRAEVVDIKALIEYADTYDTFYVGLDIDLDNYKELFSKYRPNVIVSPHTAGVSKEAIKRMDLELSNKIVEKVNEKNLRRTK